MSRNTDDDARLMAASTDLLAALKEARDASAALMRAIVEAGVTKEVMSRVPEKYDGFGVRANEAIRKAEG